MATLVLASAASVAETTIRLRKNTAQVCSFLNVTTVQPRHHLNSRRATASSAHRMAIRAEKRTEAKKPLVRGTECVELLAHEQRQPLDLRRPREVAHHTAKGRDRFGAHEKIDSGVVTPADRAFHGDANRRLARERN